MSHAVPVSLFLTRRALCPGCGAPLELQADAVVVECEYCGCESGVERRLRTVETELAGGVNPAEVARGRTRFIPAHAIARDGHAEAKCPGCGSPIDLQRAQDLAECAHCGSKSKVERRLDASADDPCDDTALDNELRAFATADRAGLLGESLRRYKEGGSENPFDMSDLQADHRLLTLLTCSNSEILESTSNLLNWNKFNPWRECMFTRLLLKADASTPKVADALFKHIDWAARVDPYASSTRQYSIRCVVRAAARVLYRATVSENLLYTLGTCNPAAMLKLLLDVAEWGLQHGHRQAADNALNAAARVLDKRERMSHKGRSKVDAAQLAQVILYRMLYMRPELLAWTLEQVPRWQIKDYRVLVRFIDDCAYERPELIAVIRDARIVHDAPAKTFRELKAHLDFLETVLTPAAREYGMYLRWYDHRYGTPDPEPELLDGLLARLAAMLDEPALRKHAAWVLSRLVTRIRYQELPAVHQFMRERGETLPVVVWWNYRKFAPDVDVPESMRFALPYAAPAKIESALADQIKQFATRHKREHEFVAEEQRREIADRESAKALKLGEQEAAAAKAAANGWKPDARTLAHYNKVLPQLRRDGSAGTLDLSSPYIYGMTNRMTFHNIEFEQTRDPRYKEYIERQEAAYEMILEHARMKYARQEAEAYARKSWLGRLLHKPRQ